MNNKLGLRIVVLLIAYFIALMSLIHWSFALASTSIFLMVIFFINFKHKYKNIYKFMILLFFFYPFQYLYYLNPFNFINPFVISGVIIALMLFFDRRNSVSLDYKFINFCYFLFFCIGLVGATQTISKLGAVNWLLYSFFTGYVVFKLIMRFTRNDIEDIIDFFIYLSLIMLFYGFFEYVIKYCVVLKMPTSRLTSLLGHPLVNAFVFGVMFLSSLYKNYITKKKRYVLYASLFSIGIILTQSRGAWLALLIIFAVSIMRFRIRFKQVLIVVLFSVIFLLSPFYTIVKSRILEREDYAHSSWDVRKKSLSIGAPMLMKNPLIGTGLFNSKRYKEKFTSDELYKRTTFENSFFEILIEAGFLGGIPYLLIPCYVIWVSSRRKAVIDHYFLSISIFIVLTSASFNILNIYRTAHFFYWSFIAITLKMCSFSDVNYTAKSEN